MKTNPDLKVWAECLVEIFKHSSLSNDQLVSVIEDNLDEIADKYYQMGFEDGDNNGWWKEQDANTCKHISNGLSYLSNPPQNKCMKCSQLYRGDI